MLKKKFDYFLNNDLFFRVKRLISYNYHRIFLKTIYSKEQYINKRYFKEFGYKIDFNKKPVTFNEKIQFRKLYSTKKEKELFAICSDKYKVRNFVAKKIGEEYLIPLVLVKDKLKIEDYDKIPNECVIKANHNSGPVQIILDKSEINFKKIVKELEVQLSMDYGIVSLESYYSLIERKIIVEKLLKDKNGRIPSDYKFYCFNNKKEIKIYIQVISNRNKAGYEADFYDQDWNQLGFHLGGNLAKSKCEKPKNLDEMVKISKKLSEEFDYSRIDLYNIDGKIYFGEITFCPNSGLKKFKPNKWDVKLGEIWK